MFSDVHFHVFIHTPASGFLSCISPLVFPAALQQCHLVIHRCMVIFTYKSKTFVSSFLTEGIEVMVREEVFEVFLFVCRM